MLDVNNLTPWDIEKGEQESHHKYRRTEHKPYRNQKKISINFAATTSHFPHNAKTPKLL